MNRAGRIRTVILIILLIILAFFSVKFTYDIYSVDLEEQFIDVSDMRGADIDGTDFTPIFQMMGYGMNAFLSFILFVAYIVVILIVSLILVIPFRLIGIRKTTQITEQEYRISKRVFVIITFVSVVIGLILTKGMTVTSLLIYNAIWVIIVLCIYFWGLSKHTIKENME